MRGLGHSGDVGADRIVVAGLELADVDDHVDLGGAGGNHVSGLGGLGGGGHGAQRETDHGAGSDVGAGEVGRNARDPVTVHADAGGVQVLGLLAYAVDLLCSGIGLEQRVVHILGELCAVEVHDESFLDSVDDSMVAAACHAGAGDCGCPQYIHGVPVGRAGRAVRWQVREPGACGRAGSFELSRGIAPELAWP